MEKRMRFTQLLTLIYTIPFFVFISANTLFSLTQTTYMELYLETENPLYKSDSPFLLLLCTLVFIVLCTIFLQKKKITPHLCSVAEKFSLIWSIVICLLIIFIFRVNVSCDSKALSDIAIAFLGSDYSALEGNGYLVHYPHQLGMIAFLEIVYYIFGIDNFIIFQILNAVAIFFVIYYLHRITDELFHNTTIQFLLSLLCIGVLPLFMYVTFIYGDIPGLGFAVPTIYFALRYLNTEEKKLLVPCFLCMTFSLLFKTNNSIILVAIIILLLLKTIQVKKVFPLVFAIILAFSPTLATAGVNSYYTHASGLEKIPDGIPKIAWIAMGLQENEYTENGWYNGYNWNTFDANEYNPEETTSDSITSIRTSIGEFLATPKYGLQFFYKKFISQWNDPGFLSQITTEWYSRHRDDHSGLALYLIYGNGRFILEHLMNLYHFLILLGTTVFTFFHIKEKNLAHLLLPLCVFGGYFFHLFWEAKSRYGLSYFILCIPMAAWGILKLTKATLTLLHKIPLKALNLHR